jgi:hypothetical protein
VKPTGPDTGLDAATFASSDGAGTGAFGGALAFISTGYTDGPTYAFFTGASSTGYTGTPVPAPASYATTVGYGYVEYTYAIVATCFATYAFARSQPMPSSVVSSATIYATDGTGSTE